MEVDATEEAAVEEANAAEEKVEMEEMEEVALEDPFEAMPEVQEEDVVSIAAAGGTGPTLCNCVDPACSRMRYHGNPRTST